MTLTRRLRLVDCRGTEEAMDPVLKVAFASTDRKHVDQHFGSACAFAIFEVSGDGRRFLELVEFGPTSQDGNEDKLAARIEALSGCAAVYVKAVGASAILQLRAKGIRPMKVAPGAPIAAQLSLLVSDLRHDPPDWVPSARAMEKDPARFDLMAAEGWDE